MIHDSQKRRANRHPLARGVAAALCVSAAAGVPSVVAAQQATADATQLASKAAAKPNTDSKLDVLILGDSQLSFGSGDTFLKYFSNLGERCRDTGLSDDTLSKIDDLRVGIMGVRSTGLQTWLSRTSKGKRMICVRDPDPKGLVNASTYGVLRTRGKWVQVGQSRDHQFCKRGKSGIEAIMAEARYKPRLAVFNFLGLSAFRWGDKKRLAKDLRDLEEQLPKETACLIFTTAPAYTAKINRPRLRAQENLKALLADGQHRCQYVPGLTKRTLASLQGNPKLFYRRSNGRVKDPFHPTPKGALTYLQHRTAPVCRAVAKALAPETLRQDRAPDMARDESGNAGRATDVADDTTESGVKQGADATSTAPEIVPQRSDDKAAPAKRDRSRSRLGRSPDATHQQRSAILAPTQAAKAQPELANAWRETHLGRDISALRGSVQN